MSGTVYIGPNKFPRVTARLMQDLNLLAAKTSYELERESKIEAPVDTANLIGLTYAEKVGECRYIVRSDAEYAEAVHEGSDHGTYVIPSNPYMTRAVANVMPKAEAAARQLQARYS